MAPQKSVDSNLIVRRDIVLSKLSSFGIYSALATVLTAMLSPFMNPPALFPFVAIGGMASLVCFSMSYQLATLNKNLSESMWTNIVVSLLTLICVAVINPKPELEQLKSLFMFISFAGFLVSGVLLIVFSVHKVTWKDI